MVALDELKWLYFSRISLNKKEDELYAKREKNTSMCNWGNCRF